MKEGTYIKLMPVMRVSQYMGLMMDDGVPYRNGQLYHYVEVPMRPVLTEKGNPRKVIKAGERVQLQAACTIEPHKAHVDVVLSGELETLGICGYQSRVERGDTIEINVSFVPFEDVDINTIMEDNWFVRLYAAD